MSREREFLQQVLPNNPSAVAFCETVFEISQVLDDLIDGDAQLDQAPSFARSGALSSICLTTPSTASMSRSYGHNWPQRSRIGRIASPWSDPAMSMTGTWPLCCVTNCPASSSNAPG